MSMRSASVLISLLALLVSVGTWADNRRAIDDERDARERENAARQREINAVERQAQIAGSSLRPILVPREPAIRSVRQLPNRGVRVTMIIANEANAPALLGTLSVSVTWGVIPPGILGFDTWTPLEEKARVVQIPALGEGAATRISFVVPRRVLQAHGRNRDPFFFALAYRDSTERVSRTFWSIRSLKRGARARQVTFTTSVG